MFEYAFLFAICASQLSDNCFPFVKTQNGWVRGIALKSRSQRTFYGFRGIPYAKPPVGELRFKDPQPIDKWEGIFDAYDDAPVCVQRNTLFDGHDQAEGEEDCLYLNVYTPRVPMKLWSNKQDLPVVVYIHYGGFFAGSSEKMYHGPEYFMEQDVVLVTFNYRLGVFGFLSTNDDAASGNWGLKDQNFVLKWVQDNIAAFGGNKKKVMIFGQSAGSVSVHFHILSPLSKGLFHTALSMSGTALASFAKPIPNLAVLVARQQAAFVGCDGNATTHHIVECLRNVDARFLAKSVDNFKFFADEPSVIFMPVIEKRTVLNPSPYLEEDPVRIIKSGSFSKVPWVVSFVKDEGLLKSAQLLQDTNLRNELTDRLDSYGPLILGLNVSSLPNDTYANWLKIKNFYLEDGNINVEKPETLQGFINMYGDRFFNYPSYRTIDLHLNAGHDSIWVLTFDYKGQYSYRNHFAKTEENINLIDWGVCHCDDLLYLFSSTALFPPLDPYSSDFSLSEVMLCMWRNLAENGHPNAFPKVIKWYPASFCNNKTENVTDFCHLNISGSYEKNISYFRFEETFFTKRMQFWRELPLLENISFDTDE